ncbi:8148_t:CDS:2, partial [Ambispora leptoticha]
RREGRYKLGDSLSSIPQFQPAIHRLEDTNEALMHYIKELRLRLKNLGLILAPQFEVVGDETTGRVDYAIKKLLDSLRKEINLLQIESACQTNKRKHKAGEAFSDEYDYMNGIVTTATEWYFILYMTEGIYFTSEKDYLISFKKSALDNRAGAVNEKPLAKKRRV